MPNVQPELDRMRSALAQLAKQPPTPADDGRLLAIGAPHQLRPGARVRDPVTGLEGEVMSYGRAVVVAAPAGR